IDGRARVFREEAIDGQATLGLDGELFFAQVPVDRIFYPSEVLITARNAAGEQISSVYTFGVHNPIEYIDWGVTQIAQIEAAEPVTGCIAGGINGQHVSYSESTAATRSRQINYHWDNSWTTEHATNYSRSHEQRSGINMSWSHNTENGWSSHWDESGTSGQDWGGQASIGGNIFGSVSGHKNWQESQTRTSGGSTSGSVSNGYTVGH